MLRCWLFAALAALGLTVVSVGVPIGMFLWMRRVKKKEDALVRHGKSRVVAHRDFGLKFGYIAGEFRPESYYAECVDLLRKLILHTCKITEENVVRKIVVADRAQTIKNLIDAGWGHRIMVRRPLL